MPCLSQIVAAVDGEVRVGLGVGADVVVVTGAPVVVVVEVLPSNLSSSLSMRSEVVTAATSLGLSCSMARPSSASTKTCARMDPLALAWNLMPTVAASAVLSPDLSSSSRTAASSFFRSVVA